jgi:hypothetical protein
LPVTQALALNKKDSEKGNKASGKLERGVNEDSPFRLTVPDNAVTKSEVAIQLEHGTPTILVEIEGVSRKLILDTGSNVSILQPGVSRGDVRVTNMEPYGVTGDVLEIRGQQSVSFVLNGREFEHLFLVCTLPSQAAGTDRHRLHGECWRRD